MFYLNALGILCSAGSTGEEVASHLWDHPQSGVIKTSRYSPDRALPLGVVSQTLPLIDHIAPRQDQSRNNQLAFAALTQIQDQVDEVIRRYGASRIGVVVGSSTSGISDGERAILERTKTSRFPASYHYEQQELASLSSFISDLFKTSGIAVTHSCACASSAKAIAAAARCLKMNVCDAVITGGVDTLSEFVVAGFRSLDSVSDERCNPLSANRNGINLGEGAALFIMSREPAAVALTGWGETSDGHHISAPAPEGVGAYTAMQHALARAHTNPQDLDYINLHGTATPQNDAMESKAVDRLVGRHVYVSSTKPFTGHTLGAAGAIEAAFCWLMMQDPNEEGRLPPHLWDRVVDPLLPPLKIVEPGTALSRPIRRAMSNSFAFGGANVSLVFERTSP
ncbi:MAG: beta-ketoacyl-ACP synthase [Burkholderiales bacterium]|jgi:3-oxoacyl-[acyl-carrier-protein] synthase-1|nr:beta-ketoacyl-ACP synthase [Burkholderiales bacterium]